MTIFENAMWYMTEASVMKPSYSNFSEFIKYIGDPETEKNTDYSTSIHGVDVTVKLYAGKNNSIFNDIRIQQSIDRLIASSNILRDTIAEYIIYEYETSKGKYGPPDWTDEPYKKRNKIEASKEITHPAYVISIYSDKINIEAYFDAGELYYDQFFNVYDFYDQKNI